MNAKPHLKARRDGTFDVVHHRVNALQLKEASQLYGITNSYSSGAWIRILESYAGAWQQNVELRSTRDLLAFPPVYACVTLIAGDIAKLRQRLTKHDFDADIWTERGVPSTSPFLIPLRKPNTFQTPYQFWQSWVISRLLYGNTYVLKVRDGRGIGAGDGMVRAMYVLDPCLVTPLIADDGEVFYRLSRDDLSGVYEDSVVVPASEIMHDREPTLWHPLVGVPPLYAAALSGTQGVNIQSNSAKFFENMSRPSGILVAPGAISRDQAAVIKAAWEANYGAANMGKTAVLGDGMKYEPMSTPAAEAQLSEQWNLSALGVAMAFHVPPYKLGLQTNVTFNNIGQLKQDYFDQCLQTRLETMEQTTDAGLELPPDYRTEFDTMGLFRMDPLTRAEALSKAIAGRYVAPNEARATDDMPPVTGGDEPFAQQQDFPLSLLAQRLPPGTPPPAAPPPAPAPNDPNAQDAAAKDIGDALVGKFLAEMETA